MRFRSTLLLTLAALLAAGGGFWLARFLDRPAPVLSAGTWLGAPRPITGLRLTDAAGRSFDERSLAGRPSLVFFGFTHCPDVCPTTLAQLARISRAGPVPGLRVIFVSIDPARDTPQLVGAYARAFDPSFLGLTGTPASIADAAREFGVAVSRVELPGGDYTMDHSAVLFLLDARARRVAVFTPPFDTTAITADLRRAAPFLDGGA